MKQPSHNIISWIIKISSWLTIGCISTVYAQIDSSILVSYADKMLIKFNIDQNKEQYSLYSPTNQKHIRLAPNEGRKYHLSLDYEFIGLSVYLMPQLSALSSDSLKGKSNSFGIGYYIFHKKWVNKIAYARTKGYYITNSHQLKHVWEEKGDRYIKYPRLKSVQWSGATAYVFNSKFSLKNLVYQTEWQKKSAGSFIPRLEYSYTGFSDKSNHLEVLNNYLDIELALAYYYTYVLKENWFIATSLSPAIGLRTSKFSKEWINTIKGSLQLGYCSPKVVIGLNVLFTESTTVRNNHQQYERKYVKVYAGYRFSSPKKIQMIFNRNR